MKIDKFTQVNAITTYGRPIDCKNETNILLYKAVNNTSVPSLSFKISENKHFLLTMPWLLDLT